MSTIVCVNSNKIDRFTGELPPSKTLTSSLILLSETSSTSKFPTVRNIETLPIELVALPKLFGMLKTFLVVYDKYITRYVTNPFIIRRLLILRLRLVIASHHTSS